MSVTFEDAVKCAASKGWRLNTIQRLTDCGTRWTVILDTGHGDAATGVGATVALAIMDAVRKGASACH